MSALAIAKSSEKVIRHEIYNYTGNFILQQTTEDVMRYFHQLDDKSCCQPYLAPYIVRNNKWMLVFLTSLFCYIMYDFFIRE